MVKNISRIGVVIVAFSDPGLTNELVNNLSKQLINGDKIVVVDNHPDHESAKLIEKGNNADIVLRSKNVGFAGGCNIGVRALKKKVDVYFFINPDTLPAADLLQSLRMVNTVDIDAWMPLLILPDGRINSAGNVVHLSGISWCDGYGKNVKQYQETKNVSVLSGACMAISAKWWHKIHGIEEGYFMYYEDTDISTRLLLAGANIALIPTSTVTHYYDFQKGGYKWYYIERNRLLYIIRTWPTAVIFVLFPLLVVVELMLWPISIVQGRFLIKIRASFGLLRKLPWAFASRRLIQNSRCISSVDFMHSLTAVFETPLLGGLSNNRPLSFLFRCYYRAALSLLTFITK